MTEDTGVQVWTRLGRRWFVGSVRYTFVSFGRAGAESQSPIVMESLSMVDLGRVWIEKNLTSKSEKSRVWRALLGGLKHEKNSLYIISSFFFHTILFIYATLTNYQNNLTVPEQVQTETYTNTVLNVPIDISVWQWSVFYQWFTSEVTGVFP